MSNNFGRLWTIGVVSSLPGTWPWGDWGTGILPSGVDRPERFDSGLVSLHIKGVLLAEPFGSSKN